MLFKKEIKEIKARVLTPEEKLNIDCQATNCIPTAENLKELWKRRKAILNLSFTTQWLDE